MLWRKRSRARGEAKALTVALLTAALLLAALPNATAVPSADPTPTPSTTSTQAATSEDKPAADATPGTSGNDTPTSQSPEATQPSPSPSTKAQLSPGGQPSPSVSQESSQAPAAADPPVIQAVPPATGNNAVITVKVGGNRTSLTAVGNLAGVTLGFYDTSTGTTPAFTCVSDADGDCSITVPNTQANGANRDRRFWVRQISTASGYYTNPSLGTGTTVAADTYQFQTGAQLRNGQTYSSQVDFMISTGLTNNEASGGIWQNSLNNPTFPAKCGINVGLVLDLSNSLTAADLTALKAASNTFVDALTGTPSQVGTFTFATAAPAAGTANTTLPLTSVSTAASATTVKNKINGLALPGGGDGGTNWDRGIYQVAQSTSTFDVAVVITDGNPTYYADTQGPGGRTRSPARWRTASSPPMP